MPEPTEPTERSEGYEGYEPTARLDDDTDVTTTPYPSQGEDRVDEEAPRPTGRHPVRVGHLVAGLLALGMALIWLLSETGVVEKPANEGVGISLVLIAAGLAGLLASVGRTRDRRTAD